MPHANRIAEFLLDIGAVKLSVKSPFIWASGLQSPMYCDMRMVLGHPEARNFIVDALVGRTRALHIEPDVIAGTATAGIPWGALIADRLDLPFAYVRTSAKSHGKKLQVEGDLQPGQHVVVVEDIISTAGSAASSVNALRDEVQCEVTDIISVFSYEFLSAREKAGELRVHLHPLATLSTLLEVAKERGDLSSEHQEEIVRFAQNPAEWRS